MPKRTDLKKILVIGSGPIVIGQAAEFDYAGTQACLALKEEGYEVILCNSNPATIMTDPAIADKVYMEPLTLEYIARIVRFERPDAIIPGIGGQTGLNLAMQLEKKGILKECHVQLLGTPSESIEQAEDRELFKELCQRLGEPVLPSQIANSMEEGIAAAEAIGYDNNLTHALYKAMQASGMKLENYGTVFVTISDEDKEEALPLIRRFYRLGFNIEATVGTAVFLRQHGIRTRVRAKVDDGSDEILKSIRQGYVTYVINTMDVRCEDVHSGSSQIRRCAVENGVTMLTALDTVRVLLDVLEEITLGISTIDA